MLFKNYSFVVFIVSVFQGVYSFLDPSKCKFYQYSIPAYTSIERESNRWQRIGDSYYQTTNVNYYLYSNATHTYVVGVCYEFSASDWGNRNRPIPKSIQDLVRTSCVAGQCDSGHLVPALLGGTNNPHNFVPQSSSLNRGSWRTSEEFCADRDPMGSIVAITIGYDYHRSSNIVPRSSISNLVYSQPLYMSMISYSNLSPYIDSRTLLYLCGKFRNDDQGRPYPYNTPQKLLSNIVPGDCPG
ncbi:unnamed protein product [Macrosiphum euphorbiae]|uniref:Type VII secretion system protein EssD-like domain-containing protein n=1 Tax=Macrosiphum euphorbiae TaxID=13131 RepID=A0AAV0VK65_9HEMI|nr:unnamed protein product [Macrosiphum euphorbiae]